MPLGSTFSTLLVSSLQTLHFSSKQERPFQNEGVRGTTDRKHLPWPDAIVNTCMSDLKWEVVVKNAELTRYHQVEEFKNSWKERENSSSYVQAISQNPPRGNPSWKQCTQPGPWVRTIGQGWKSTQLPEHPRLWATCQGSSPALSSGNPFPIKSLPWPACVSPRKINFWVIDKSPLLGLGRKAPPFLQHGDPTPSATLMSWASPLQIPAGSSLMITQGHRCAGRYLRRGNRGCESISMGNVSFPQSLSKRQWLWNCNHRSIN